jgi:DNA primase
MDHVEEIKAKLNIVDLVSNYIELKKAGRNWRGLCPFHKEKTPSFMVSPEKGIAYCFSCRKGGDIFAFIQELEGMDFPQAVEFLAEKAHVVIEDTGKTNRMPKNEKQKLMLLLKEATQFFREQIQQGEEGERVRAYIEERGLTSKDQEDFLLGYAPKSGKALVQHLLKKGFHAADMDRTGVVVGKTIGRDEVYDRFHGRIIYPLCSDQGEVIAFAGRIFGEGEPKYLNSPETSLYHKRKLLYGMHLAKQKIKEKGYALIVEGYMDVIACHRAGIEEVVGVSGTALTEEHVQLLKRYTDTVYFCFDEDSAGRNATIRSFETAARAQMMVKVVRVPGGKDPDEVIKTDPSAFLQAITEATPFLTYYLSYLEKLYTIGTPEGKKIVSHGFFTALRNVQNVIEQEHYLSLLADTIKTNPQRVFHEYGKFLKQGDRKGYQKKEEIVKVSEGKGMGREEDFLALLLYMPEKVPKETWKKVSEEIFKEKDAKRLYSELKSKYDNPRLWAPGEERTEQGVEREYSRYISLLEMYADETYGMVGEEEFLVLLEKQAAQFQKGNAQDELRLLKGALKKAELEKNEEKVQQIMQEINHLLPRLKSR